MSNMSMRIDFSTNAKVVKKQIDDLSHATAKLSQQAKFARALDTNKASARELTGQLSGRKAILKLEQQIAAEAERRMKTVASGYRFGNKEQNQYVRGLIKQNEVMRIRTKILNDNATAMVNLGKNTQWAGRQLVVGFTVPLTIAAGAAMKAFADLEKEMVRFKRVYGDVTTTGPELKEMANQVKALAVEWTKYGVAVSDTVQLAADAAGAGFKGDQLISQINSATKLAVLGELEKQKAMKATIALQSTFRMSNDELGQSINFLNQLENSTMVTMDDMATAIPKAATVVQGLGGDIKDLGVFMAALEEGGVSAAEAANALKSGLGSLLNPSKAANEQLAGIGVNMDMLWEKSEKNGRGVISVVEDLATALDRLGQTQKQRVIEELFGKHQFARMNALLSNINTGTQARQAKDVAGTGQLESALIAQQELAKLGESSLTKFQSSLEELKAAIAPLGEQVMKLVTPLVEFATKLIDKFNSMPDLFKQISVGIVAALGVVAPLMLMLLGQFQNLLGNGMKLTNWMRSWGKNTKWIAVENLTLADALGGVNAKLVAENALLQTNQKAWKTRQAAAGASAATMPLTLGGRLRRFATGGSVDGAGNGDTVPALLTPGEFVVKKSVAEKFGDTLRAMNDGRLQGFVRGAVGIKPMPAKAAAAQKKVEGLTPEQVKAEKARSYASLMKYKTYENNIVSRIHSNFVKKFPQFTFAGVRNWLQWDQSHIGRADKNKIYNKELDQKQKLWNYKGDLILDNHMININLPSQNDHPVSPDEVVPFHKNILDKLKGTKINPNHLITEAVLNFRQRAAGADFYNQYMDDNFIFMNLIGGKKGTRNTIKSAPSGKWSVNAGKEIEGVEYLNRGGWVPGTGNKDSVPAVLTPGEAVIKKSAAQKFAPILNAMNNGSIGLFANGKTDDRGYRGPLSSKDRTALLDPARAALEATLVELQKTLDASEKKMKKIRKQMEADLKEQTRAAHIVPIRDEFGKKVYDDRALVGTTRRENQAMRDMGRGENEAILRRVAAETKKSEQHLAARNAVLDKLVKGEHIIVQEERDLLKELMIETEQLRLSKPGQGYAMSKTLRGSEGMAVAGGLSTTPLVFATKKPATEADEKMARKVQQEVNPKGGGKAADVGKVGSRFDPYTIMMMLSMFGGEISGVTSKLGKFGDMLTMALPALATMQMMGMMPNLNMKGMLGRGTGAVGAQNKLFSAAMAGGAKGRVASAGYGLAGKFGKFGLGAGLGFGTVGAIGGSLIGNMVSDGKGGARDNAGKAISWGATGAGLGMMFGPWGAAIGGAVGALAGFTASVISTNKELKKTVETMEKSSLAWENIGKQLSEKYQIGGNVDMKTFLTDVSGMNKEQTEMYQMLREDMKNEDGPWTQRIKDLTNAASKGMMSPQTLQTELAGLTMQLRGQGVDDESIDTILKAFVSELPDAVTKGVNASNIAVQSTDQILSNITSQIATMPSFASTASPAAPRTSSTTPIGVGYNISGMGLQSGYGSWTTNVAPPPVKGVSNDELKKMAPQVTNITNSLNVALSSLTQTLVNAKVGSEEYKKAQADLIKVNEEAANLDKMMRGTVAEQTYLNAAGSGVDKLIGSGQGMGLSHEEWKAVLKEDKVAATTLNQAAEVLIIAGHDLSNFSSVQIAAMGAALMAQQAAVLENQKATADRAATQESLAELSAAAMDRDNALAENADRIKFENIEVENAKVNAQLDIDRINIEEAVLAKFVGKFNKAFGTAIDSFADAQFQIDKIGAAIQAIQLKKIAPLQEKADDLRRLSELDGRKIDALQKKAQKWDEAQQKRIKKLTDAYDEQAKALERIRQQNEYIADQQRANISLADALSKGDLAGAANAMVQSSQNQQNYAATLQDQQLADARSAALAAEEKKKNPYDAQIDKIQERIDARALKIQALEDRIYNINEKQVEPLQRKADLMNLMLSTTKMQMEYDKANASGRDAENLAREQAAQAAQKALYDAQNMETIEKGITKTYQDRIEAVAKKHGIESKNAEIIGARVEELDNQHAARVKASAQVVAEIADDIAQMANGNNDVIAMWEKKVKEGTIAGTIQAALDFINGEEGASNPSASGASKPQRNGYYPGETSQGYTWDMASGTWKKSVKKAAGGTIPGTGGQDSVAALLTPGEYVMRKSAVDRIGVQNLERMNMGPNFDTGGFERFATGGKVGNPNFLGIFGDTALQKISENSKIQEAMSQSSGGGLWDKVKGVASRLNPFNKVGKGVSAVASAFERLIGATTIQGESVYRKCAANVRKIWTQLVGPSTVPMAPTAAKKAALLQAKYGMNKGYNAPRGALYWWNSKTGGGAGHVAVSDGRGNALNNWGGNKIERRPVSGMAPSAYMGWTTKLATGGYVRGKGKSYGSAPLKSMNSAKSLNRPYGMPMAVDYTMGGDSSVVYNDYNLSFSIPGQMDANEVADFVIRKIERAGSGKVRSRV